MDDDADGSVDVTETDGVRAAAFVCGFVVCSVERLMLQHSALCPIYKQVLAWKDTVAFGLLTRDIYLCKATLKKAMYCQKCFTNTWQCSTVHYAQCTNKCLLERTQWLLTCLLETYISVKLLWKRLCIVKSALQILDSAAQWSTTYWFAVYSYTGLSVLQNFYREEEHTLHVVIGFLIFQLWVLNG